MSFRAPGGTMARDATKATGGKPKAAPKKRGKSTKSKAPPMPRSEAPKRTGRPPVQVDVKVLEGLAKISCTYAEMAAILDVSENTLERRFGPRIKAWAESGKSSLRRAQWKAALAGDRTMLVWLGKQMLGQRDNRDSEIRVAVEDIPNRTDAELEAEAKALGLVK